MAAQLQQGHILKCRLLFLILFVHIYAVNTSHIEVGSDGGYKKVVVAVSQRAYTESKSTEQIREIMGNFFKEVSKEIYTSSPNQIFLSEIQVLLPRSWRITPDIKVKDAVFESFHEADIRLDSFNPTPDKGDLYTHHPRGRGESGDFIYLNPHFLQEWSIEKNKTYVNRFVQEWLTLTYGIFKETELKRTDVDTKKNSGTLKIPQLNFVRSTASVVLVIDPLLLQDDFSSKGSHMLALSLRKIISDLQVDQDGQFGCVIADGQQKQLQFRTKSSHGNLFDKIVTLSKGRNTTNRYISNGINTAIKMFPQDNIQNPHIILMTYDPKLTVELFDVIFSKIKQIKFFLLTWTSQDKELSIPKDISEFFVKNYKRSLWFDIKMKINIGTCDLNSRIQIEEAFNRFNQKFLNDDFYGSKTKIKDAVTIRDQKVDLTLPNVNSTIMFNIFSCTFDTDEQRSLLTINTKTNDVDVPDRVSKNLLVSYNWERELNEKNNVEYSVTFSRSSLIGSSVWIIYNAAKNNMLSLTLDASIEKKQNDKSLPFIIYAFNPNDYSLTANFTANNGYNFTLELKDNGNGDPDVVKGDKIYTRYLIGPLAAFGQLYSAKIIARDNAHNIAAQIALGTVYHPVYNIKTLPPNQIGDLLVKPIDPDSQTATLTWTSPGAYYDYGSVTAYYLYCSKDFNPTTIGEDVLKNSDNKIEKQPKESGLQETYDWIIPSSNTTYICVMLTKNENNIWSEISNVVSIHAPTSTYSGEVRLGVGEIIGIIIAILIFIVLTLLSVLIFRLKKHKLIFAKPRRETNTLPSQLNNEGQDIEMTSNKPSTLDKERIYVNVDDKPTPPFKPTPKKRNNLNITNNSQTRNEQVQPETSKSPVNLENPEQVLPSVASITDSDDGYTAYATSSYLPLNEDIHLNSNNANKTQSSDEIERYGTAADDGYTAYATSSYFPVDGNVNLNSEQSEKNENQEEIEQKQPLLTVNINNTDNTDLAALYSQIDKSKKVPRSPQ